MKATCVKEGNVEYWHCDTCNTNFSNEEGTVALDQIEIDIIPHDLVEVESKYATCTETGVRYHWHCNSCGKNFRYSDGTDEIEDVVVPARGHVLYFCQGYEETCEAKGERDHYRCENCSKIFLDEKGTQEITKEDLIIPPNDNHDLHFSQGHAATCQNEGRKDYYRCSTCGRYFFDEKGTQEVTDPDKELRIPRTEHEWIDYREPTAVGDVGVVSDGKTHPVKSEWLTREGKRCKICGLIQDLVSVRYVLTVNAHKATLKYGQSTTGIKVIEMNANDYLKSVTSKNTSIVKVSDVNKKGTFKLTAGKKSGTTLVEVRLSSGVMVNVQITVQSGTVKTSYITGLKKSVTVSKGKTYTLKPGLDPITSQEKVTYSSSNTKVATVSSKGVITGKAAGTAKITVKSGSKKATVTVKVEKVKTTKLSGVPSSKTVKKGKTFAIKASVTPKNSDEKVTYKTSNKKIATVTSSGVVKGVKKGTVTITVQSGSKKQTCKVTVK